MGKKQKAKAKVVKQPQLPPEVSDDEIQVSDDDLEFVSNNYKYARFVSRLDTQAITKHVTRVADEKDDLEALHEKRLRKRAVEKEGEGGDVEVDPADVLPVKTLDGQLYFQTGRKASGKAGNEENEDEGIAENQEDGKEAVIKLTKAERRAKMKKIRKEAKMQAKEQPKAEEGNDAHQAEVVAELEEDLTAEEICLNKKKRIAELGTALLTDPEANIKSLKELLLFCKDEDDTIVKLVLLSCAAVFKDIVPGYRIRLPTEKEKEMTVSKDVKRMRFYESVLLLSYKIYLQRLLVLEQRSLFHHVAIRCICNLLEAVPHFNFRENLLPAVVNNVGSLDDTVRSLCCTTIKSLLLNEGKHGGEATMEVVRLIADHVRLHDCELHPDSIEVFLSLSFDEDLGRSDKVDEDDRRKNKRQKNARDQKQTAIIDRKRGWQELLSKAREEVNADIKAATFTQDVTERRRMQAETLSAVFETYFRVLKHTVVSAAARFDGSDNFNSGAFGPHPLLAACLKGVGKFSHLIDLDYMVDLMKHLKVLASSGGGSDVSGRYLTISERMQCCIVAFRVMKTNLDALKIDLHDFFVQLYNLILEYRPGRDQGEVFSEALKIMLCDDRQHDMQRAAAFIKRLSTSALSFGSAESMAALVTVKNLLQKNVKCRNMLDNDPGGGSVSGSNVKYRPCSTDPHLSSALASVLWELNLLAKHYHPAVSSIASSISSMGSDHTQVYLSTLSPQQAFSDLSLERESFVPKNEGKFTHKRKRGKTSSASEGSKLDIISAVHETSLQNKLLGHVNLLRDIKDREKLLRDLDRTTLSLMLYKEYRQEK